MPKVDYSTFQQINDPNAYPSSGVDYSKFDQIADPSGALGVVGPVASAIASASTATPKDIANFLQGGVQGISNLGEGLTKLLTNTSPQDVSDPVYSHLRSLFGTQPQKPFNVPHGNLFAFNPQDANTKAAKVGSDFGQTLATAPLPGGPAVQGATMAALNSANDPNSTPLSGTLNTLAAGAGGKLADLISSPASKYLFSPAQGLRAALRKVIAGKGNSGEITPAEFQSNLDLLPPNINLPIGDTANSSSAKTGYNTAQAIPFSGTHIPYQNLNLFVRGRLNGINNDLNPSLLSRGSPIKSSDVDSAVFNDMKGSYDLAKNNEGTQWNNLYGAAQDADNQSAGNFAYLGSPVPTLDKVPIKSYLGSTARSITDPEQTKGLNGFLSSIDTKDQPIDSITNALDLRKAVNNRYQQFSSANNGSQLGILNGLRTSIDQSLDNSTANNPQMNGLLQTALNSTKAKIPFEQAGLGSSPRISPFKQRYDTRLNNTNVDNGIVNDYLKPSVERDSSDSLGFMLNNVRPQTRSAVASNYLFDGASNVNPAQAIENYNKLGDDQKSLLFSPDHIATLDHLSALKEAYPETFNINYNPKTGFSGARSTAMGSLGTGVGGALLLGHPITAAAMASPIALGQAARRVLTSPFIKNQYVKSLTENPKNSTPFSSALQKAFGMSALPITSALTNGGNQNAQ